MRGQFACSPTARTGGVTLTQFPRGVCHLSQLKLSRPALIVATGQKKRKRDKKKQTNGTTKTTPGENKKLAFGTEKNSTGGKTKNNSLCVRLCVFSIFFRCLFSFSFLSASFSWASFASRFLLTFLIKIIFLSCLGGCSFGPFFFFLLLSAGPPPPDRPKFRSFSMFILSRGIVGAVQGRISQKVRVWASLGPVCETPAPTHWGPSGPPTLGASHFLCVCPPSHPSGPSLGKTVNKTNGRKCHFGMKVYFG